MNTARLTLPAPHLPQSQERNFCFIDCQNLCRNLKDLGWKVDWKKFHQYLYEKHNIVQAFIFLGYMKEEERTYHRLRKSGFKLIFKKVKINKDGSVKGNVDGEIILKAALDMSKYDKAVIITSDGDFACIIRVLKSKDKLRAVISPSPKCSFLLKELVEDKIIYMEDFRPDVEWLDVND